MVIPAHDLAVMEAGTRFRDLAPISDIGISMERDDHWDFNCWELILNSYSLSKNFFNNIQDKRSRSSSLFLELEAAYSS
ncbi:hypothetical protein COCNU_06G019810 [Cocos nucifera]|uniref:Uncharacterized protein n=1 Tax=Cocos nucifera TaxID=13894 RepID=A0A8K0IE19_COCNU|nr:hypothetical protein COCNU_06G019810 [Cocos nucifera]